MAVYLDITMSCLACSLQLFVGSFDLLENTFCFFNRNSM